MAATTICVPNVFVLGLGFEGGHELKRIKAAVQHVSNATETTESVSHNIALST
jgi:hypothetical protein